MVIYKLGINLRSFKYRIRSQISATFFSRNKEVENTGISISQFNLHLVNNDLDHAFLSLSLRFVSSFAPAQKESPTSVTGTIRPTTFDSGGSRCFPSVRQSFRS